MQLQEGTQGVLPSSTRHVLGCIVFLLVFARVHKHLKGALPNLLLADGVCMGCSCWLNESHCMWQILRSTARLWVLNGVLFMCVFSVALRGFCIIHNMQNIVLQW